MKWFAAMVAALSYAFPVHAAPVVADLSNYHIDIDARFIGTKLFLFGTRVDAGDVVVVVRGPEKTYTVRKKERIGGVWLNRRYAEFSNIPTYFAVASSKPVEQLSHIKTLRGLQGDEDFLGQVGSLSSRKLEITPFRDALMKHLRSKNLYQEPSTLQFMGESLFKASLSFPASLSGGNYTAEIYLIRDDELIGMQVLPIAVQKIGIEATIANMSERQPVLYGLLAILMALSAGWIANRLFHRL